MTEENKSTKNFSIVLKLEEISELNGQIDLAMEPSALNADMQKFFAEKYGDGGGRLEIATKSRKVKLTWQQPVFNSNAEDAHRSALSFAKLRNYKEAINAWVRAIALNASDPDYYFNLGIAFYEGKNYKEAIENFQSALKLCPIYYKAYLILGTVYLKTRKFDNAENFLRESLIFYPKHPLAHLNLGAVYSILKRYDEGIRMFLKTIEIAPTEVRAHFGLAKIYSLQGESAKANEYYKKVIDINANQQLTNLANRAMGSSMEASTQLPSSRDESGGARETVNAEHCYAEGYRAFLFADYDRAVKMYHTYVGHKPDDDFVWYSLGEACLRAGNLDYATKSFQKAIELNPSKAVYHKELAIALNYIGKTDEAIQSLSKAEQLGKNDSVSYTIWGKVLLEQQKFEEALEVLQKALKLNSNNLLAKYNMAIATIQMNQRDIAATQLSEIIRAPINSPLKMEAEKLIKQIEG